jgi:predicted nucleic acid-binding protein
LTEPGYLVIDASVSLKWALDDEDVVEQALALRDDSIQRRVRMVAPSIWRYEVTNGLVTAVRRRRISEEQGFLALHHLTSIGVSFSDPDLGHCYRTALSHRVASYDSAYLALADQLGTILWTGDRKFWEAVRPVSSSVRWIGDYLQAE